MKIAYYSANIHLPWSGTTQGVHQSIREVEDEGGMNYQQEKVHKLTDVLPILKNLHSIIRTW